MKVIFETKTKSAEEDLGAILRADWGNANGGKPLPRTEDESVGGRRVGDGIHGPWPVTTHVHRAKVSPDGKLYAILVEPEVAELVEGKFVELDGTDVKIERSKNLTMEDLEEWEEVVNTAS